MTAQASLQTAVAAVNQGAFYYVQKPFSNDELLAILRRACEYRQIRVENRQLKQEIRRKDRTTVERPIGKSRRFIEVLKLAEMVAPSDSTVLIQGESGTGKEVIARYLHNLSARPDGPFLSINCGALPENLLESELFGVMRGAFTGADRDRKGLFEEADGGTVFLDEIGELPLHLQAKLLRVVQEQEIRPLGSAKTRTVDVRILAATNRDLERAAEEGTFRKDLFYRLAVLPIRMPPLRERREDIPYLAEHFLRIYAQREGKHVRGFEPEAIGAFERYEWPGNVRELENEVHRLVAFCADGQKIDLALLSDRVRGHRVPWQGLVDEGSPLREILDRVEAQVVGERLRRLGGNKTATAESLGVNRETLYQKIAKYGIAPVAKAGRGPAAPERSEGSEPPRGNGGPAAP
jgi:two-component system response regulator HydG